MIKKNFKKIDEHDYGVVIAKITTLKDDLIDIKELEKQKKYDRESKDEINSL